MTKDRLALGFDERKAFVARNGRTSVRKGQATETGREQAEAPGVNPLELAGQTKGTSHTGETELGCVA